MAKTIQEIIDYVDEIDENKYSPKIKTVWLNEVEGIIQSQVLDVPEWAARYYVYAAEGGTQVRFPNDRQMVCAELPGVRPGGKLTISGLDTMAQNNVTAKILGVDAETRTVEFERGTFAQTGETVETAQLGFDGSGCEVLLTPPWDKLYYDYMLAKLAEHRQESAQWNNRLSTFNDDILEFSKWCCENPGRKHGEQQMRAFRIKRGDEAGIPVEITLNGRRVEQQDVEIVEICIAGAIRKVYPGEVYFDEESGLWVMPLQQAETFSLRPGLTRPDVRVHFAGGGVLGAQNVRPVLVLDSQSGEEI